MNNSKYEQLRNEYSLFIYRKYEIESFDNYYLITYYFDVPLLCIFTPKLKIPKKIIKKLDAYSKYIIFNIGMVELISYWKLTCSRRVVIEAGYLADDQIKWFKKLYYYGLGELFYRNGIVVDSESFMEVVCEHISEPLVDICYMGKGNLIPVGGGKDSCVTSELLRDFKDSNYFFMINPKEVMLDCVRVASYDESSILAVERILDKKLIDLNSKGFINGHTPFSAIVAFVSLLVAYENDFKYIVLSNEYSANEATVIGTNINHQYSKTYEFECDFNYYVKSFLKIDINYFSLLRALTELQIAFLFSKYDKYHGVFKSCNSGSKNKVWKWCCSCPKCLFIYIVLSPFLPRKKLISIFGEDLFEKEALLDVFISLIGGSSSKPFECVGSIKEVRMAISKTILAFEKNRKKLPFLLKYYANNYELVSFSNDLLISMNTENNIEDMFLEIIKREMTNYVPKDNR